MIYVEGDLAQGALVGGGGMVPSSRLEFSPVGGCCVAGTARGWVKRADPACGVGRAG